MRVVSALFAIAAVVGCAVEDAPREYTYSQPVQQLTTTQVTTGQAITATSRDGSFGIQFAPGSFAENVSVQINQGNSSPAPAVTLSKSYAVTVNPPTATLQQAVEISFVIAPNVVASSSGASYLQVGHGETLGQPWYQALSGIYDSALGRFTASTSSFSYFLVFDSEAFNYCTCDVGPECQFGCEFCDDDCGAPPCVVDGDCDSECCVEGACVASSYCDEPVSCFEDYDCESNCCLDAVCMPASYCSEPDCIYDDDCESLCCVEGVCEPSNVCNPNSCTYDYECETNCCSSGVCSPSNYCVESCSYDYQCESGCCFDSVCAPSEFCAATCVYNSDCDSNCCVEGMCALESACVACSTGALRCSDNWVQECVAGQWSFDGANVEDCGSFTCVDYPSDMWATCEEPGACALEEWQCNNGGCIHESYRCDRYTEGPDCVDGSDEDPYCPMCTSDEHCPAGEFWHCDIATGTCYQG